MQSSAESVTGDAGLADDLVADAEEAAEDAHAESCRVIQFRPDALVGTPVKCVSFSISQPHHCLPALLHLVPPLLPSPHAPQPARSPARSVCASQAHLTTLTCVGQVDVSHFPSVYGPAGSAANVKKQRKVLRHENATEK